MDEHEWRELLERQEKRMRRKGWRNSKHVETGSDANPESQASPQQS